LTLSILWTASYCATFSRRDAGEFQLEKSEKEK